MATSASLRWTSAALLLACAGCNDHDNTIVVAGSAIGAEGEALRARVHAFEEKHPGVHVEIRATPDGGDDRHQLYVQWFAAGSNTPDVLQLDVVWTPEFAAAGFLLPVDDDVAAGFFPAAVAANRYAGRLYAAPWFVDAGLLYRRSDLVPDAPATLADLADLATSHRLPIGFAWQGARYEGLVCVYLEILTGMGGAILDEDHVVVDDDTGQAALTYLVDLVDHGASPRDVTAWREEDARFAFQNGRALFMRNWPYAAPLLADAARAFAVSPMPGDGTHPGAATLGGQSLAVNARSAHPALAQELVRFLLDDEAQIERARVAGEYPPRAALYDSGALDGLLPLRPQDARAILERAVPRPASPAWSELSGALQVHLHEALTHQATPKDAVDAAARDMRAILAARAPPPTSSSSSPPPSAPSPLAALAFPIALTIALVAALALALLALRARAAGDEASSLRSADARFGWRLAAPPLWLLAVVAGVPFTLTILQSSMDLDLRTPWRGAPFVGLKLYFDAFTSERFVGALVHTLGFAVTSVGLEVVLGLGLALVLHRAFFARGAVRAVVLLPWAIPAVVSAIIWRFVLAQAAPVSAFTSDPWLAWIPILAADVWKSTPFVTLLLLAGLAQIDPALHEAAAVDGASAARRFFDITLPLLKPALTVAVVFRVLDAVRVFDVVYVLTGGGPGTATETVSILAYDTMMRDLRFGAGAAVSMLLFIVAFALTPFYVRAVMGRDDDDGGRGGPR